MAHSRHDRLKPLAIGDAHHGVGLGNIQQRLRIQLKTQGIAERQSFAFGELARFFVGIESLLQLLGVHGNPPVFDQSQPLRGLKQAPGLFGGYRRIGQIEPDIETEQRVHAQCGRRAVTHGNANLQSGRPSFPPIWNPAQDSRLLVQRDLKKKGIGLFGRPGERMK